MKTLRKQRVFCTKEDWGACLLEGVVYTEEGFTLAPSRHSGSFCMKAIDSGETDFAWERVSLEARITSVNPQNRCVTTLPRIITRIE